LGNINVCHSGAPLAKAVQTAAGDRELPRQIYHKPVRELLRDMPTLPSDEFPFLSAQAPFSRPLPRGVKHGQDVYLFAANAVNSEIVAVQYQFPRSINPAGLAWKVRGQHAHFRSELAHKTSRS
jgi:hypothetical protein